MTVSLNANGLDDISSLMRLLVKVNPDMMPKDDKGPTLSADPNILTISNNHPEPLKMLPEPADLDGDEDGDLDNDEDEGMAGSIAGGIAGGIATKSLAGASTGAKIGSEIQDKFFGDEEETEEDLDGGFQSANTSNKDTKTFDTDKLVGKSNGIDKEKDMVKHSYKQGDNPMAMKDRDFKESIKLDAESASTMFSFKRWSEEVLKAVALPLVVIVPTVPLGLVKIIWFCVPVDVLVQIAEPKLSTAKNSEVPPSP
jgi:hypothetical protein